MNQKLSSPRAFFLTHCQIIQSRSKTRLGATTLSQYIDLHRNVQTLWCSKDHFSWSFNKHGWNTWNMFQKPARNSPFFLKQTRTAQPHLPEIDYRCPNGSGSPFQSPCCASASALAQQVASVLAQPASGAHHTKCVLENEDSLVWLSLSKRQPMWVFSWSALFFKQMGNITSQTEQKLSLCGSPS